MKKKLTAFIAMIFLCTGFLQAAEPDIDWSFGIINDNLLTPYEWAQQGLSAGPDDFLTNSFFLDMHINQFQFTCKLATITSRQNEYRYDLLIPGASWEIPIGDLTITPGAGIIFSGNFGGAWVQNTWHNMIGYPQLLTETENFVNQDKWALEGRLSLNYRIQDLLWNGNELNLQTTVHISGDLLPCYIEGGVSLPLTWQPCGINTHFEFLLGGRAVFNEVDYYSDFFTSSFFGGILGSITIYQDLAFNFGFALQAGTETMTDDPAFNTNHEYSVFPQFWWVLSYKFPPGIWNFISL